MKRFAALALLILGNIAFAQAVGLVSPDQNATFNSGDVAFVFNATDDLSTVLNCTLALDGANESSILAMNATDTQVNVSGVAEGAHNWSVSCTDDANSTGVSETRTFDVVLPSPPSVTLDSPADNATMNSSTVDFLFTASEAHNASMECTLSIDGKANASAPASSGIQGSVSVSGLAEGAHTWSVGCVDSENETGSSGTQGFSITLPPLTCAAPVLDNMTLGPNQYGWLNASSSAFEFGPLDTPSKVYNLSDTRGCSCTQIVQMLGLGKGQLKKGCSPGIMQKWTGLSSVPDRMSHARQSPAKGKKRG